MKPKIIIPADLFSKIKSKKDGTKHCYGLTRLSEGLVQIMRLEPQDDLKKVARIRAEGIELEEPACLIHFSEMEPIRLDAEFTARSRDMIDTNALAGKKAVFIGVGSVGSQLALQLAQSALGHFSLWDLDRLSASNLSRHACGLTDLARFKTKAVRDLILSRNPQAIIQAYEDDFLALSWSEQAERLAGADLVIASTDSTAVQFMVNEICHDLKIPSLYIGCYERACAGEVLFVVPGKTACFNCFMEFRQSSLIDLKKKNTASHIATKIRPNLKVNPAWPLTSPM